MEVLIATILLLRLNYQVNPPVCYDETYLLGAFDNSTIILCEDNVENKELDNETVVRHEMIHVGQKCNSGLIDPDRDYYALLPDFPYLAYDSKDWDIEAEARVLTQEMTSNEVAEMVTQLCEGNQVL